MVNQLLKKGPPGSDVGGGVVNHRKPPRNLKKVEEPRELKKRLLIRQQTQSEERCRDVLAVNLKQ